jgi:hypothetical protein
MIPWGSLPLELYVLSQWTSLAIDDLGKRRRQLAQQFTTIGYSGRFVGARYRMRFHGSGLLTYNSTSSSCTSPAWLANLALDYHLRRIGRVS